MSEIHPEVYKSLHDMIDMLQAEIVELKLALMEREWQPIETAPEDCDILVFGNSYGDAAQGWHCMVARRDGSKIYDTAEGNELDFITHWMPLPAAPKQEDDACRKALENLK